MVTHRSPHRSPWQFLPATRALDGLVCVLLVAFGALQYFSPPPAKDSFRGDTIYIELAHSILDRGTYGVDYNDVQYPPGLPALLAGV